MLLELHIRNMAIVRDARLSFDSGLTVLTGETGAGKSVLLSGLAMLLGGRAERSLLEDGKETLIEAVFQVDDSGTLSYLSSAGIEMEEDGIVSLVRRIDRERSVLRCNGSIISLHQIKGIARHLIDIHGQQDDRMLLDTELQKKMVDGFDPSIGPLREKAEAVFGKVRAARENVERLSCDEGERLRMADLLSYEVREIEEAGMKPGEMETLEAEHRMLANASRILDGIGKAQRAAGDEGASELIGEALRSLLDIAPYDPAAAQMADAMQEIDSLLSDAVRDIARYADGFEYDEERLVFLEERLGVLHRLISKYGGSEASVLETLEQKSAQLHELTHHEEALLRAKEYLSDCLAEQKEVCGKLTEARRNAGEAFSALLQKELSGLHFAKADFAVQVEPKDTPGPDGADRVEFYISTNPGQERRPLRMIASGGELSRIMLGIRSVFAGTKETGTIIFDEIDAGIGGETAVRVAEKLYRTALGRQVICITHLPQIAAMADCHYTIEKNASAGSTISSIRKIAEDEVINELARMIGGADPGEHILSAASDMRKRAEERKAAIREDRT